MKNKVANISQREAGSLINRLVEFLGKYDVKHCLQKYEHSLKTAGPIFREYYLKWRHPWLGALVQYYELANKAKSICRHLTPELEALAIDAKKVVTLQKNMPNSVKENYRKNLLDFDSARNYLFEIEVAWHFFVNNCDIIWYEANSSKLPEFLVRAPSFHFNVECKRISVDIARKIHRKGHCSINTGIF